MTKRELIAALQALDVPDDTPVGILLDVQWYRDPEPQVVDVYRDRDGDLIDYDRDDTDAKVQVISL